LPFDLLPARVAPEGVYLRWEAAEAADSSQVIYRARVSEDSLFATFSEYYAGTDTSLLLPLPSPGRHYWRVHASSPTGETRSLHFFQPFDVPEGFSGGTTLSGSLPASETWTAAAGPIRLPDGLTVSSNTTLTIEPGVVVALGADANLRILGGLFALGAACDSVRFIRLDPSQPWGAITLANPSDSVEFAHVVIDGGSDDPSGPSPGGMIQVDGGILTLRDSRLAGGSASCLNSRDGDLTLERVDASGFPREIIRASGGSLLLSECRFSRAGMEGNGFDLVDIEGLTGGLEVSGCRFYGGGDDALDLDDIPGGRIRNLRIFDAGDKGISIGGASQDISLANCIITGCDEGISVQDQARATIYNSVMVRNAVGLRVRDPLPGGRVLVRNAVLWRNDEEIHLDPGAQVNVSYSYVYGDQPYPGSRNLRGAPGMVDPWNGNFALVANSLLIDAGYGTGYPELDFDGLPRVDVPGVPNTGAGEIDYVDIGAYEYPASVEAPPPAPVPENPALLAAYPNPFNVGVNLEFRLLRGDWVELSVYNVLGELILHERMEDLAPGRHRFYWDGRTNTRARTASGILFLRLKQESGETTIKLVHLK
ncbi:MAG TPA: hypothetical protein ENI92_03010, partial [Bacteroidetes bacterium]|nr:hypothetical protein [Bacteroidota bacterium]